MCSLIMDTCGICQKSAVQLFETNQEGVFACFKCQPLVPEVTLGPDSSDQPTQPAREISLYDQEGDTKDLYCGICNKTFQKTMQLQNHLRNHRAERRFVCTYCNKAFSQSNNLRAHLRIHTNERPYKCNVCDKAFTQVTNLNNHMRLHTGERPFVCPEPGCGKAYAQVTNLNQHRKRHLSGRPLEAKYVCRDCGEQFDQRNHMFEHRREMHGDSTVPAVSLVCKICDLVFQSEKKLASHVAGHTQMQASSRALKLEIKEEPEYKCVFSTCGARFSSPSEHTEHLLSAHQLRVLSVPEPAPPPRRGRPPKALKVDPLDPKESITYEMQVKQLKELPPQYLPKFRVHTLFQ